MNPVEFQNIQKSFGRRAVLQGLTWSLAPGSITGLLGNNGAGKSTLMQILLGLIPADSGEVALLGDAVTALTANVRRRIGYVPQTMNSFGFMTV